MRKHLIIGSIFGIILTILILQSMNADGREKEVREMSDKERVLVTAILEKLSPEQQERVQHNIDAVDGRYITGLFLVRAKAFAETH